MRRTKTRNYDRGNDADDLRTVWAAGLKVGYDQVSEEPMPDRFHELLRQLDAAESRQR